MSAEWLHSKCVMKVNPPSPDLCNVLKKNNFFLNPFESEIHLDYFLSKDLTCLFAMS